MMNQTQNIPNNNITTVNSIACLANTSNMPSFENISNPQCLIHLNNISNVQTCKNVADTDISNISNVSSISSYNHNSSKSSRKSKFTPEEDNRLIQLVNQFSETNWNLIALYMNGRNVRQCRERWRHYLSPSVSNAPWTAAEDYLLDQKYAEFGPKWKQIAEFFPSRTDINIKNRYLLKVRHMERLSSQIAEMSAEYTAKMQNTKKLLSGSQMTPQPTFQTTVTQQHQIQQIQQQQIQQQTMEIPKVSTNFQQMNQFSPLNLNQVPQMKQPEIFTKMPSFIPFQEVCQPIEARSKSSSMTNSPKTIESSPKTSNDYSSSSDTTDSSSECDHVNEEEMINANADPTDLLFEECEAFFEMDHEMFFLPFAE